MQERPIVGIIGGGQLARILAIAAAKLGIACHIFCPDQDSCALEVTSRYTIANYEDEKALSEFFSQVSVATFEFENVSLDALRRLGQTAKIVPNLGAVEIAQD